MQIGYARVSTTKQDTDIQEAQLRDAGCERLFVDRRESSRPELKRMLGHLRASDVVIITKLDRLGRSLQEMLSTVEQIEKREAGLRSLGEAAIDTTTQAGRLTFQLFAVVSEFERNRVRERTVEGLAKAKQRGVRLGAPRKLGKAEALQLGKLRQAGWTYGELSRLFHVSRSSAHRYALANALQPAAGGE